MMRKNYHLKRIKMMQKTQLRGVLILCLTAVIWGSAFVTQSMGMESVEPFTFNGVRMLIGAAVLLPVILIKDAVSARRAGSPTKEQTREANKKALRRGAFMGLALCAASNCQQFAFLYSQPGKIAFITAFYMFFVPFFGLFLGKRVPALTWGCVAAGIVGLYFLCVADTGFSGINLGDVLTLICAMLFSVHILLTERVAADSDTIKLSCVQFAVCGAISCGLMFLFESPSAAALGECWFPLLYTGVLSCGVAYTLQVVGQKYTESTVASLILCTESVFGVLSSALILHERMTANEIVGCSVMFAAIVVSQLADRIPLRTKGK